ncbi:AAA family ATPase [Moraxella osloensis]|uniref:ATPase n=1 Tax=Faucicola osloensis TaxID=34062 RepID=A0A2I5HSB1_FAUOS|nr:ATP-binding protein [Moraxella osloensis]ATW71383.1 ATPase [Moraxella osloensis]
MTDNFSITIKNFKSYKEATLPLAPLTLLIGANASGKSNAIEAFRFLSWVAGGERLSTLKNRVNDSDKIIRGTVNDLTFSNSKSFNIGFQFSNNFIFDIIVSPSENILKIVAEIFRFQEGTLFFYRKKLLNSESLIDIELEKLIKLDNLLDGHENFLIQQFGNHDFAVNFDEDDISILSTQSKYNLYWQSLENFKFSSLDKFRNSEITIKTNLSESFFFDFVPSKMRAESLSEKDLRSNGQNLAGVLHYLCEKDEHASDNETKLLNLIKSLPEQNIIDIKFYVDHRQRVEFALIENFGNTPKEFPMDLLSDGTLKVLAIATALLSVSTGSTLVIEEIDNSIHPSRAHDILSLMRQYAEERGLKLLLSTHNPALMDAIPDKALADVVFCYRDPQQGDSRLVRLGDLDDYVGLVVQGSLGDLVTRGIVERFVKHPKTKEEKKKQALDWLKQMQVDSQ